MTPRKVTVKKPLQPSLDRALQTYFKLLKCLILRFAWRLLKVYHGSACFSTPVQAGIGPVNVPFLSVSEGGLIALCDKNQKTQDARRIGFISGTLTRSLAI